MDLSQLYVAFVIAAMLVGLIVNIARPAWLFSIAALALYFPGFIDAKRMFSHAVNPAVLTLILLLISSLALERTRVLNWVGRKLFSKSYLLTIFRMGGLVAITSAFLNNTAVVASLVGLVRNNSSHPVQKLLIPLSYFAILGGTLTLIGTSTNLIVNSFLVDYGEPGFKFFDFLPVGLSILLVSGVAILISSFWISGKPVVKEIGREYFLEANIAESSPLVGVTIQHAGINSFEGLTLFELIRQGKGVTWPELDYLLQAGDILMFSGDATKAKQLAEIKGLTLFAEDTGLLDKNLTEVIVSPGSTLIGRSLKQSSFRAHFDAAVVAIRRNGARLSTNLANLELGAGDKLLLAIGQGFHQRPNINRNFILLDKKPLKPALKRLQEFTAFAGFFAAVAGAALGFIDLLTGLLIYLLLMIGSKVISPTEIRRRLPIETWLVIASALAIADVFNQVGVADLLSRLVQSLLSVKAFDDGTGVYWAFIICYLLTWLITEVVTNNAAAALMFPMAFALAESLGVSYMPFVMAVAYGASASFISPFGYQTNLIVMNAGNLNFADFAKAGWLVSVSFTGVALVMIPIVFPF